MKGVVTTSEQLRNGSFYVAWLAALTLTAFLMSTGVSDLIRGQLAPLTVAMAATGHQIESERRAGSGDAGAIALLFAEQAAENGESLVVEPDGEPPTPVDESAEIAQAASGCQSSAPVVLVGTMVDAHGDWSIGIVHDRAASRTTLVRAGMTVGGARVVAVQRHRVWLLNDGRRECLDPNREPAEPPVTAETAPPEADGTSPPIRPERLRPTEDPLAPAVDRRGPFEYAVDRAAVEALLADSRTARQHSPQIDQHVEGGRPAGVELVAIPAGSLLAQMGLRDGDLIREVDGTRLTSVQRLTTLLEALRDQDRVELVVDRRGRSHTFTYLAR